MPDTGAITRYLKRAEAGDEQALGLAYGHVYDDLKRCAHNQLRGERMAMTTISLVNETYLRIAADPSFRPQHRRHLIGLTSRAMREVLIDRFRGMNAVKRGGANVRVTLSDDIEGPGGDAVDAIELDRALTRLEGVDERMARIVEWRYFGGYSETEIADVLGVTERTVQREWRKARAFLLVALSHRDEAGS